MNVLFRQFPHIQMIPLCGSLISHRCLRIPFIEWSKHCNIRLHQQRIYVHHSFLSLLACIQWNMLFNVAPLNDDVYVIKIVK